MQRLSTILAAAGALAVFASVVPAKADWHHDWHGGRDWHGHYWHGYPGYAPGYYAPPPVVYAPPPAYYGPPAVVFAAPGISIGIP